MPTTPSRTVATLERLFPVAGPASRPGAPSRGEFAVAGPAARPGTATESAGTAELDRRTPAGRRAPY